MFPEIINSQSLHQISEVQGLSKKEWDGFSRDLAKAETFICSKRWCGGIAEKYFGLGLGGIIEAFLFRIIPKNDVDEWLWVIAGDIPSAYLVTDEIGNPTDAILAYCDLMEDWASAVLSSGSLDDVFPVDAEPTRINAESLMRRINMIKKNILPNL
jgi:hypothetical protein